MAYTASRKDLDNRKNPHAVIIRTIQAGPHVFDSPDPTVINRADRIRISPREVQEYRTLLRSRFTVSEGFDLMNYHSIDQEGEGACSFVAFVNMAILSGNAHVLNEPLNSNESIRANWKRLWKSFGLKTACDLAFTLDLLTEQGIVPEDVLEYIPIRSAGNSENGYNTKFWIETEPVKDLICVQNNIPRWVYEAVPFVYQTNMLLETLIEAGYVVEVNAFQHSRVLVGFNATHFLFADTWGDDALQPELPPLAQSSPFQHKHDFYKGGFSTIDRFAIATHVRDIAFFKKNGDDALETVREIVYRKAASITPEMILRNTEKASMTIEPPSQKQLAAIKITLDKRGITVASEPSVKKGKSGLASAAAAEKSVKKRKSGIASEAPAETNKGKSQSAKKRKSDGGSCRPTRRRRRRPYK